MLPSSVIFCFVKLMNGMTTPITVDRARTNHQLMISRSLGRPARYLPIAHGVHPSNIYSIRLGEAANAGN